MALTTAMAITAGVAAASGIAGGAIAASGAKKAAKTQAQAAEQATDAQERMFREQQALQEPFRQGGLTAQNRIMELLGLGPRPEPPRSVVQNQMVARRPEDYGLTALNIPNIMGRQYGDTSYIMDAEGRYDPDFLIGGQRSGVYRDAQGNFITDVDAYMAQNPLPEDVNQMAAPAAGPAPESDYGKYARDFGMADFEADPGYAFRQSEGMKALERSAAARGGLLSGGTLKGIQRFGQDLASQEYTNAFNRYQVNRANQLNPLQSLMGSGQSSANVLTGAAGQMGQNQAAGITNAAQARASGYVGSANALSGALGGLGNLAMNYPVYNAQANYLKSLSTGGGGFGGVGGFGSFSTPASAAPANYMYGGLNPNYG
jgi:hypothetical protein